MCKSIYELSFFYKSSILHNEVINKHTSLWKVKGCQKCHSIVNNRFGGIHKLRWQNFEDFWPPSPFRWQVYKIRFYSIVDIWETPSLPFTCQRSLWMPPFSNKTEDTLNRTWLTVLKRKSKYRHQWSHYLNTLNPLPLLFPTPVFLSIWLFVRCIRNSRDWCNKKNITGPEIGQY